MIKLYLVRHGETKGNVEQWYQGSTDIPLNDKGRLQAQCLSEYLKDVHFDGFYSSDLSVCSVSDKNCSGQYIKINDADCQKGQ